MLHGLYMYFIASGSFKILEFIGAQILLDFYSLTLGLAEESR